MLTEPKKAEAEVSSLSLLILFICILLFVALRVRWVGHLLVWDEAMSLCTIRSFLSNGTDDFSNWFWRHPPLFSVLMMLTSPFKDGFAERVELMSIAIGAINLILLFQINRKFLGTPTALWASFFLAVQPGSVFFDVWIKTDHTVTTFGLLAILLLAKNLPLYSGLCLGLALLSKETGIFYVVTVLLLWLCGATGKRTLKDFTILTIIPPITCGWWYFGVKILVDRVTFASTGLDQLDPWYLKIFGGCTDYVKFALSSESGWNKSWNYYLTNIPLLTGFTGFILSFSGILLSVYHAMNRKDMINTEHKQFPILMIWPLLLLLPSYCVLSAFNSKVPWIVIVLLPAWATLQGFAVATAISLMHNANSKFLSSLAAILLSIALIAWSLTSVIRMDYERMLKRIDAGQWRGAHYSREIAESLDRLITERERILITSFHYWKGLSPGHACPVFAYYLTKKTEILIRPHQSSFASLVSDIKKHRIDWAALSPEQALLESDILPGFINTYKLSPFMLDKAVIFTTTSVYREEFR